MKHEECIKGDGFSSRLDFEEVVTIEPNEDGVTDILFKEYCDDCGEVIGKEIQSFKYFNRREVEE